MVQRILNKAVHTTLIVGTPAYSSFESVILSSPSVFINNYHSANLHENVAHADSHEHSKDYSSLSCKITKLWCTITKMCLLPTWY